MNSLYDSNTWHDFGCGHPGGLETTRSLLERSGLKEGARVLDLACGSGDSVAAMRERGLQPFGLDRPSVIARAQQKYPDFPDRTWHAWQDDPWQPFPIAEATVAAVLCECSFSLFAHPQNVLREIRRVLMPNGVLLISDVSTGEPFDLAGFRLLTWQDETAQLKAFVARWIWETGTIFPRTCRGNHYFSAIYHVKEGLEFDDGF